MLTSTPRARANRHGMLQVVPNRVVSTSYNHSYSNKLPHEYKATSQKATGRCWMFAALNLARGTLIEKYSLPANFELSQSVRVHLLPRLRAWRPCAPASLRA